MKGFVGFLGTSEGVRRLAIVIGLAVAFPASGVFFLRARGPIDHHRWTFKYWQKRQAQYPEARGPTPSSFVPDFQWSHDKTKLLDATGQVVESFEYTSAPPPSAYLVLVTLTLAVFLSGFTAPWLILYAIAWVVAGFRLPGTDHRRTGQKWGKDKPENPS